MVRSHCTRSSEADNAFRSPGHTAAPSDRSWCDRWTDPFEHHLFQVAVAECVPQVPAHVQQNAVSFKVAPFEWALLGHEKNSFGVLIRSRAYHTIVIFATQPYKGESDLLRQPFKQRTQKQGAGLDRKSFPYGEAFLSKHGLLSLFCQIKEQVYINTATDSQRSHI